MGSRDKVAVAATDLIAVNGVLFPSSIGDALGGLIACGVLARHPGLSIMAGHGGGSLLTQLPRMEFLRGKTDELQELMPEPAAA